MVEFCVKISIELSAADTICIGCGYLYCVLFAVVLIRIAAAEVKATIIMEGAVIRFSGMKNRNCCFRIFSERRRKAKKEPFRKIHIARKLRSRC